MNTLTAGLADTPWMVWVIALPLAAGPAVWLLRRRTPLLAVVTSLAATIATIMLALQVWHHGVQQLSIGGWGAPLGIDLQADGLSVCMMLLTAIVGLGVSAYATAYFEAPSSSDFWALWFLLWAALNALFLSRDIFNLYVTLELVTMSAVGLVALAGTEAAFAAALQYLIAALVGSLFYLAGVALLYAAGGVLDISALGRVIQDGPASGAAVTLIVVGLALKAAIFPLHSWLPPAHGSAPAPVSALLSGLVVKASFYVLLRLWFEPLAGVVTTNAGTLLAVLGAAAIGWGSLHAALAPRFKTLVAYSTVAQLGYLVLVFGLARPGETSMAREGAVLFALSHGCAKAAMFLAGGSIMRVAGHDTIASLAGTGRRLPVTFFTLALASVTLMGLPPSGAFVAKWMLLRVAIETGRFWIAIVIVAGGLLAAIYLFRILGQAFTSSSDEGRLSVPRPMELGALALALVALLLGLVAAPVLQMLDIHTTNVPAIAGWGRA
jgi:multicomponent Na+:H+ antiporter subunit D